MCIHTYRPLSSRHPQFFDLLLRLGSLPIKRKDFRFFTGPIIAPYKYDSEIQEQGATETL